MTSVILVHGTGVRQSAYQSMFELASSELSKVARVSMVPCYWGHLGSDLHAGGASIPTYDETRAAGGDTLLSESEYSVALWDMLYDDALYELRVLGLRSGPREREIGEESPGDALARRVEVFRVQEPLRKLLIRGDIDDVFGDARSSVTRSKPYRDTLLSVSVGSQMEERSAIARALIAASLAQASLLERRARTGFDSRLRDDIEAALVEELGGTERSIGGWVKARCVGLVFRVASRHMSRRRGAITDGAHPAAGDILLYQARGDAIRRFIRERILETPPPRILVAHSLGGIACVDLLAAEPMEVALLVTVGSQAPFLYEIDALSSLRYGDPLPEHFPARWLNIYDQRDFLSYLGGGLFPNRVRDTLVDNDQPFPVSHSAYWSNPAVWQAVAKELP